MKMQTPMPTQLEYWIKTAINKKTPYDQKQNAILHLMSIRDIIDSVLSEIPQSKYKNSLKANHIR